MKAIDQLLKKFSLKQIGLFFILLISLQVITIIGIKFYKTEVTHSQRPTRLVGYGINLIYWLYDDLGANPHNKQRDLRLLRKLDKQDALFTFTTGKRHEDAYTVANEHISLSDYQNLTRQFKASGQLTLAAYYPQLQSWANITLYNDDSFAVNYAIIIMMFAYLLTIGLLVLVFKSYRRLLPLWLFRISVGDVQKQHAFQPSVTDRQTIHKMQKRINRLLREKNLMLSALSHDLKTPLSAARIETSQLARHNPEAAADLQQYLEEINQVIDNSLKYAEVQYHCYQIGTQTPVSIDTLVQHLRYYYRNREQVKIIMELDKDVHLYGDQTLLLRALQNVINNALAYATHCTVSMLCRSTNQLQIRIHDNGPGIDKTRLQAITQPFYRGSCQHTDTPEGHGLGLAIARLIVTHHHGRMKLYNGHQGGLIVDMIVPISAPGKDNL